MSDTCTKSFSILAPPVTPIPYWAFEESSGNFYNPTHDMYIARGTFTTGVGKIGNGCRAVGPMSNLADVQNGPAFNSVTDTGISFWFWMQFGGAAASAEGMVYDLYIGNPLFGKRIALSFTVPAFFPRVIDTQIFASLTGGGGSAGATTPFTNNATFVCVTYHNALPYSLNLYVNNAAAVPLAIAVPMASCNLKLVLDCIQNDAYAVVDELGIVPQEISPAQVAALYNGGSGVTYPAVASIITF